MGSWAAIAKLNPLYFSDHSEYGSAESLGVTLAYLKGKDAESEEAQEHANSSSLAQHRTTDKNDAGEDFLAWQDCTNLGSFIGTGLGLRMASVLNSVREVYLLPLT